MRQAFRTCMLNCSRTCCAASRKMWKSLYQQRLSKYCESRCQMCRKNTTSECYVIIVSKRHCIWSLLFMLWLQCGIVGIDTFFRPNVIWVFQIWALFLVFDFVSLYLYVYWYTSGFVMLGFSFFSDSLRDWWQRTSLKWAFYWMGCKTLISEQKREPFSLTPTIPKDFF